MTVASSHPSDPLLGQSAPRKGEWKSGHPRKVRGGLFSVVVDESGVARATPSGLVTMTSASRV